MKEPKMNRVISVLLAVLLLTQSLCLTAFAAEGDNTVVIPGGTSVEEVNTILSEALLGSDGEEQWEYYCEGKTKIGTWGNRSWGSVGGFTTKTGSIIKTEYTHPALADNGDDSYQVRVAGTTIEFTIRKLAEPEKADAPITLHDGTAALNAADLKEAVFYAVVDNGGLDLTADDVSIQYEGKGALGIGTKWYNVSEITETGTYTVKVIWDGNDDYYGFEDETSVEITSGKEVGSVSLRDSASAALVYNEDNSLNVADTTAAVFDAVVESINPDLTVDDVTVEYYATATSGAVGSVGKAWMPLGGGKKDLLTYPAISEGDQRIRVSWGGNDAYEGFSEETTVTMTARAAAPYTLNDPIGTVKLIYNEDMTVDYGTLYADVFNAVIASSEVLTPDNVEITYHATAKTGAVGDLGRTWIGLEGGTSSGLTYPAISAGEQQIRISWAGNSQYAPTTVEAAVTVADREVLTFQLKEGPCTVGIVFTAEQGVDYDATARAIYDAAVESTAPIQVAYEDVKVEYDASLTPNISHSYKPLNNSDTLTKKFGEGTWSIRFSWSGNREYAPGSAVVSVEVTDSRLASAVVLREGVSFVYNKDVAVMKQAILDSVIDWDHSTLPARETLSADDFTFTYNAKLSLLDGATGDVADSIVDKVLNGKVQTAYVPFEGKSYDVLGQTLGSYPQIGAGEQQIKVSYNGGAAYKPSAEAEGTVNIEKASVKVSVKSASMYVSQAKNGLNLVTTDPVDEFDMFVLYAGINSNVTTGVYLELPARYTSNSTVVKVVDGILSGLGRPTLTQMLQNGITVGELRELLNATEVIEALEKLGVDTGSFGQIIKVVNKLPAIGNNLRIGFGVPNKAGIYTVTAITNNANYKTGVGVGALVLKADKAALVWNQNIGKKISAADAKNADFGATLQVGGEPVDDQSSVHVLYSGFTSKWKVYSSTTTPPTEAGRYTMTVVILGGNYLASPITRSFQITK